MCESLKEIMRLFKEGSYSKIRFNGSIFCIDKTWAKIHGSSREFTSITQWKWETLEAEISFYTSIMGVVFIRLNLQFCHLLYRQWQHSYGGSSIVSAKLLISGAKNTYGLLFLSDYCSFWISNKGYGTIDTLIALWVLVAVYFY